MHRILPHTRGDRRALRPSSFAGTMRLHTSAPRGAAGPLHTRSTAGSIGATCLSRAVYSAPASLSRGAATCSRSAQTSSASMLHTRARDAREHRRGRGVCSITVAGSARCNRSDMRIPPTSAEFRPPPPKSAQSVPMSLLASLLVSLLATLLAWLLPPLNSS